MSCFNNQSGSLACRLSDISGGSRGGAPLFWVQKEEMTEGKMAGRASKSRPPPPPLTSRSDPPLGMVAVLLGFSKAPQE